MCSTPAAPWAWSRACCRRPSGRRTRPRPAAEYVRIREQFARGQEVKARAARSRPRATTASSPTGPATPRPHAVASSACAPSTAYDLADLADHIDWTPFFASWELVGRYPLILEDEMVGEAARDLFEDAQAMLKRIIDEKWFTARGVVGFWPANARRRRHRGLCRREPHRRDRPLPHPAPADGQEPNGKPNLALSDFVAPAGRRRLYRRLRRHRRPWRAGDRQTVQGRRATTIPPSWPRRWPTVWPRPSPRPCTSKVRTELWGYAPDEALDDRRPDRREIPGHPPGARLSGPARPHREGDPVPPAGGRSQRRHGADRELRHDARRRRSRASISPIRRATTSASARSSAIRSRTTPGARAGTWRPPNAGWRRSSTTIPARPRAGRGRADAYSRPTSAGVAGGVVMFSRMRRAACSQRPGRPKNRPKAWLRTASS